MSKLKISLDTNLLIALENNESTANSIKMLNEKHKKKEIIIRITAISASEKQHIDKSYSLNFSVFKDRLSKLGLSDLELLKPPGYSDITYYDHCIYPDKATIDLEKNIHNILFPTIEFFYTDYFKKNNSREAEKKWKNKKCDVLCLLSHIYYKGNIFITTDRNFFKKTKKDNLIKLGAKEILTPEELINKLQSY
jgi:hypothetical protein